MNYLKLKCHRHSFLDENYSDFIFKIEFFKIEKEKFQTFLKKLFSDDLFRNANIYCTTFFWFIFNNSNYENIINKFIKISENYKKNSFDYKYICIDYLYLTNKIESFLDSTFDIKYLIIRYSCFLLLSTLYNDIIDFYKNYKKNVENSFSIKDIKFNFLIKSTVLGIVLVKLTFNHNKKINLDIVSQNKQIKVLLKLNINNLKKMLLIKNIIVENYSIKYDECINKAI